MSGLTIRPTCAQHSSTRESEAALPCPTEARAPTRFLLMPACTFDDLSGRPRADRITVAALATDLRVLQSQQLVRSRPMMHSSLESIEKSGQDLFVSAALEVVQRCPGCDGAELVHERTQPDNLFGIPGRWQLDRCTSCSLIFVNPRPSEADLGEAYEALFPNQGGRTQAPPTRSLRLLRVWHWLNGSSSFQARFIPSGHGTLLDVGCGTGALGAALIRRGYRVLGVELNRTHWQAAAANGVEVVGRTLEDADIQPDSLDGVVYADVLEHVCDPGRQLRVAAELLRRGGRLYIACPNYGSLQRRLYGDAWHGWHLPFHLNHFSPTSLRAMLKRSGFSEVSVRQESPVQYALASWRTRTSSTPLAAWNDLGRNSPRWLRVGLGTSLRVLSLLAVGDQLVAVARKP